MYTLTTVLKVKDYQIIFGVHRNTARKYMLSDKRVAVVDKITVKIFCELNGFTLSDLNS